MSKSLDREIESGGGDDGSPPKVHGRGRELRMLGSFLDRAARDGAALALAGEPGVGKSLLLDLATEMAANRGIRILRGSGTEFEADLPYSGLNQFFVPLADEIGQLDSSHSAALRVALGITDGSTPERLAVSNAMLSALRLAARPCSLLLVVDDMQWFDRLSADVIEFIANRVSGTEIGLLIAARLELDGYLKQYGTTTYEVLPLELRDSIGLVESAFPALASTVRDRIVHEAQGNPLALLELPAGLTGAQKSATSGLPTVLPLTHRLEALFGARITALPESTRRLLLLSSLESTGDLTVLTAAEGSEEVLRSLSYAETARLIQIDTRARRLTFRHPLIRSAVVQRATTNEISECHSTLARLLENQPEKRAWHLAEASIEPNEEIAELLEQVARQIRRRGDAARAVASLIRAAELSPDALDRSRRLAEAAYLGMTGELSDVSQVLIDARGEQLDQSARLYAAAAAAYALVNGEGDVETAHSLLVGALEEPPGPEDKSAFADALRGLNLVCFLGSRQGLWEAFDRALYRLQPDVPTDLNLVRTTLANPAFVTETDLDSLDSEVLRVRNEQDPWPVIAISSAGQWVDRLPSCRDSIVRVANESRSSGSIGPAVFSMHFLCLDDYVTGRWDDCLAFADEGARLSQEFGSHVSAWVYWLFQAFVFASRGSYEHADALCDRTLQWAVPRGAAIAIDGVHCVRGIAALGSGDYEESFRHLSSVSRAGVLEPYSPWALWVMMDLVESSVRTKRFGEAQDHVTAIQSAGVSRISARLALFVRASEALVAGDDEARDVFEMALAIPGIARWPFSVARVQLIYGERLRRLKAPSDARVHLTAALETFRILEATPWAERAAGELRASGQTPRRATSRVSLTPQEEDIAKLAASGLPNREIGERLYLSHRTVGAHLYRIFPKLGITSRAALRDALGEE